MYTKEIENTLAISISKDLLLNMESILKNFFTDIQCVATLKNKNRKEFETIKELCEYENALEKRIEKLEISAYSVKQESVHLLFEEKEKTSICGIISTIDYVKTDEIYEKINYAIRRKNEDPVFSILASAGYKDILFIISLIILMIFLIMHSNSVISIDLSPQYFIAYVELIAIYMGILAVLYKIKKYLFPIIVFDIGDEIGKNEKRKSLKKNLMWAVLVATVISVSASFIYAKLSGK